ncbi:nuclease-related domain-containing protein [Kineococcus sp. NPDC059986]|uniref:nuclease-related domain-containing protein n=1 Tax=Kineococcus sp. NPDC059986 TaxID=3155538 RepID=UPI003450399B
MGVAGGRADEKARRAAERAALLRNTTGSHERFAAAERVRHAWATGAEGERLVAQTLANLHPSWQVLHDVRWPGRPFANIDHLAIGPGGIVVVDAKKWSGRVTSDRGVLRQNGYRRDGELDGVAAAAAAVAALVNPRATTPTRGVLCLVDQPFSPTGTASGVTVVGRPHLVAHLHALDAVLDDQQVADLTAFLRGRLDGDPTPRRRSTRTRTAPPAPPRRVPQARSSRRPAARTARQVVLSLVLALTVLGVSAAVLLHLLADLAARLGASG